MNFFENRVLEAVKPILTEDEACCFFAGSLFIDCGLVTLSNVVLALSKMGAGSFKVNSVGDEFAIDFI